MTFTGTTDGVGQRHEKTLAGARWRARLARPWFTRPRMTTSVKRTT